MLDSYGLVLFLLWLVAGISIVLFARWLHRFLATSELSTDLQVLLLVAIVGVVLLGILNFLWKLGASQAISPPTSVTEATTKPTLDSFEQKNYPDLYALRQQLLQQLLAVVVLDDADTEALVFELRGKGYRPLASVEHETQGRLATVRLLAPQGVKVDLLTASSGIEHEVVEGATPVTLEGVGALPVASAEDLLSLKVLSMTDRRLQDRIDADRLVAVNPNLDLGRVRHNLELITARGFHRDQDLLAKLEALIANGARAG